MNPDPAVLLVDSNTSDRDLALFLLNEQIPRRSILVAADPLSLADALRDAPAVSVVSTDLAWAAVADVIACIRRRSPVTAVLLFGTPDGIAAQSLAQGLAVEGVVPKNSAGYLTLASVITEVLARPGRPAPAVRSPKPIQVGPVDRMIGSPGISASDVALLLPVPPGGADRSAGRASDASAGRSRPHRSLVMESSSMPDGPTSFEMRGSEPQPVPVETLAPAIHDATAVPVREGLPPTFRMRADAHYVESLDTAPPAPKLQVVDVSRIDPRDTGRVQPVPALVASIRSVGVLQPLIVEPRNGRFRLLAGDRRLAAAKAAGLRDVPCIVRRAGDETATEVAAAANLFVADDKTRATQVVDADAVSTDATRELTRVLSSLARCLPLLEQPASNLARAAAMNVAMAEVSRATWLAEAAAVACDDAATVRRRIPMERLVTRVLQAVEPERRLRGIALNRQVSTAQSEVAGSEDRLVAALAAAVVATMELVEGDAPTVTVTARTNRDDSLVFSVAQSSAAVPPAWRPRATEDGPTGAAGAGVVALTVARRLIEASDGRLSVSAVEYGSEIQVVLPRVS